MNDSNFNEEGIVGWPADWPGRQIVDLDNVGDPGIWVEEQLPTAREVLDCDPSEDISTAEMLAGDYINTLASAHFPLPTDFGMSECEVRAMVVADFVGFIREWRNQAFPDLDKGES